MTLLFLLNYGLAASIPAPAVTILRRLTPNEFLTVPANDENYFVVMADSNIFTVPK